MVSHVSHVSDHCACTIEMWQTIKSTNSKGKFTETDLPFVVCHTPGGLVRSIICFVAQIILWKILLFLMPC